MAEFATAAMLAQQTEVERQLCISLLAFNADMARLRQQREQMGTPAGPVRLDPDPAAVQPPPQLTGFADLAPEIQGLAARLMPLLQQGGDKPPQSAPAPAPAPAPQQAPQQPLGGSAGGVLLPPEGSAAANPTLAQAEDLLRQSQGAAMGQPQKQITIVVHHVRQKPPVSAPPPPPPPPPPPEEREPPQPQQQQQQQAAPGQWEWGAEPGAAAPPAQQQQQQQGQGDGLWRPPVWPAVSDQQLPQALPLHPPPQPDAWIQNMELQWQRRKLMEQTGAGGSPRRAGPLTLDDCAADVELLLANYARSVTGSQYQTVNLEQLGRLMNLPECTEIRKMITDKKQGAGYLLSFLQKYPRHFYTYRLTDGTVKVASILRTPERLSVTASTKRRVPNRVAPQLRALQGIYVLEHRDASGWPVWFNSSNHMRIFRGGVRERVHVTWAIGDNQLVPPLARAWFLAVGDAPPVPYLAQDDQWVLRGESDPGHIEVVACDQDALSPQRDALQEGS